MKNMREKPLIQIGLSEKGQNGKPGLIEELLRVVREGLPGSLKDLSISARKWWSGKAAQEAGKADQILAEVFEKIGRLNLDEAEQVHRHAHENARHDAEMQAKRQENYYSNLQQAIAVVKALNEMGVDIDLATVLRGLPSRDDSLRVDAADLSVTPSRPSEDL